MWFGQEWKRRRNNRRLRLERIRELEISINRLYEQATAHKSASGSADDWAAYNFCCKEADALQNTLTHLLQGPSRSRARLLGIEIPASKLVASDDPERYTVLSDEGELWLRQERRKYRDSRIEFWAKIVLPILSLIISIIALLRKH